MLLLPDDDIPVCRQLSALSLPRPRVSSRTTQAEELRAPPPLGRCLPHSSPIHYYYTELRKKVFTESEHLKNSFSCVPMLNRSTGEQYIELLY